MDRSSPISCVLFACALVCAHGTPLFAQPEELKFHYLSLEQGLSQSTVNTIVQDGLGFLWFGTQDGLNRYDGYTVTVYKHSAGDTASLADNGIWSLCRDRNGDIWIGTVRGGLNRFNIRTSQFKHYLHTPGDTASISDNNVTSVFQDSRGYLWAGTLSGGLNVLDPATGRFRRFLHQPGDSTSLSSNTVWSITEDRNGTIWIATWGGVSRYNVATGTFTRMSHPSGPGASASRNNIRTILADRHGIIWIGTWGSGLEALNPRTGSVSRYTSAPDHPGSISSSLILSLAEDSRGTLWVGTGDAGLNRLDRTKGRFVRYQHDPAGTFSLNNNIICSLYEDRAGALWIGTGAGGVNKYDWLKNRFPHFRDNQKDASDLSGNDVWAMLEDRQGILWIGTYGGGLNAFDRSNGIFRHYRHNPRDPGSLSHDNVIALCESRTGDLWIGTEGGGLNRLDPARTTFTHYKHDSRDRGSISQNEVTVLREDRVGRLWIGTNGSGLDRFDPSTGQFSHYFPDERRADALRNGSVMNILEDSRGHIWVGTLGGGLQVLNPATGRFQSYIASPSEKNGPSTNTILSLYEDRDNILWIGTYGGGLDRFDRATSRWEHFTEAEGLPNNVIYGILPDDGGNLWLTTNKGLARFHPATAAVKTYDVHDGLQGNEFNQGSYHRSRRGEMFIGGINGLNAFFPDSVRDNPYPPPVYLTSFRVFDKPIALATPLPETREIVLPHDRNFFSVEFVALSYTSPQRNQYMYILEGLDEAWRDAGTRRYTTYTNLDPGSYTLRIRGSNNDGLWNMEGTMVSITIVPPYWKTWWFRILAVLGAGALLFLMYRYRVQKLLEIERIRTAIATDLHDDIGSSLTEIALFSDLGLRELRARPTPAEDGKLGSILADIGTTSRNLIDAMNDIVWSVDPKNDSFDFLLVRMKMHASKMLDARGINYEIDIPEELSSLKLPLGYRRRLFLIYKEAINNILKHARPTTVSLSMRREGRTLMMTIVDDGIGFDPSSPAAGNGLHNMQERARTLGGEITIASARTRGTAIALHAPIP